MPEYRRIKIAGGTYFFTVVTYSRRPVFSNEACRKLLRQAWENTRERFPFETIAVCLMHDHLHCIWQLPENDMNYSVRWKEIKRIFTKYYLRDIGTGEVRNESRQKRREAAIWQRRFWEHTIVDEMDFKTHIDYVHYNPVKHGYVKRVADWPWSSFMRFVKNGVYDVEWMGEGDNVRNTDKWE